jgi:hypothetical protein
LCMQMRQLQRILQIIMRTSSLDDGLLGKAGGRQEEAFNGAELPPLPAINGQQQQCQCSTKEYGWADSGKYITRGLHNWVQLVFLQVITNIYDKRGGFSGLSFRAFGSRSIVFVSFVPARPSTTAERLSSRPTPLTPHRTRPPPPLASSFYYAAFRPNSISSATFSLRVRLVQISLSFHSVVKARWPGFVEK